jgi:hypothetical protein
VFDEGVFKSTDDGKTWTLKKTGLGHPDNMRVCRVILHRDGTLFAIICARRPSSGQPLMPEGVGLYRSKDGAETWEKIDASKPLLYPRISRLIPTTAGESCWGRRMPGGATNRAAFTSPRTVAKHGSLSGAKARRHSAATSTQIMPAGFT